MAEEFDINDALINPASSSATKWSAGLLGAAFLGHKLVAKGINTLGFGNVEGSYASNSKIQQYADDLITLAKGKRRRVPEHALKSLLPSSIPVELSAARRSLIETEKRMSILKSQGARIPKALKEYHMNLQTMMPEREMAQAIVQRSLKQPITFKHGGKFIEQGFPQQDKFIGKALEAKGFNINMPIPQFDVSSDKFMIKKLRIASTGDPRLRLITKLLKQGDTDGAKKAAKFGLMEYKGEIVESGAGRVNLFKEGNKWVTKYTPHYARGRYISPVKEYVVGGHTQMTTFKPYKGHTGFHKATTRMFDITSYASIGEKGESIFQKARIKLAGKVGQALGIHTPVVTTAIYQHRAPGGGRAKGATDIAKRKSRKYVESGVRTYSKGFEKARKLGWGALKFALTKGRKF